MVVVFAVLRIESWYFIRQFLTQSVNSKRIKHEISKLYMDDGFTHLIKRVESLLTYVILYL
jgi:hypothetical protein